jgi:hypothetical protein
MSSVPPPPPPPFSGGNPPPPPPYSGGPGYSPSQMGVGRAPDDISDIWHNKGLNILLSIVTCGIWSFLWVYHTNEELKRYNGDGLGGVLGVVIMFVFSPVLYFTIPNEIQKMYERDGRESPVRTIWGLWFLLPIIGNFIWYLKVQDALNEFWASKGARRA